MKVGVLSLQGDYREQAMAIDGLPGVETVSMVRDRAGLEGVDALMMPGGESTSISDLLDVTDLREPLEARIRDGLPVLATCAGLILLAKRVDRSRAGDDPKPLGVIDVALRRNDYGRQADSFEADVRVEGLARPFPGVFIRAPRLTAVGAGVERFARYGSEVVGVRKGSIWGLTFHPELSPDRRLHELWLRAIGQRPVRRTPARKRAGRARGR
ncbi:MAG TPA: pyridoxal 5'-phosphate synthase glutaminase subunit PdxT [Thermoplasmata archaeon]|nr:pyridoxal 5'-phosphate synthase glutaminase subunit PdxT [Thermoplasmata archaeon]